MGALIFLSMNIFNTSSNVHPFNGGECIHFCLTMASRAMVTESVRLKGVSPHMGRINGRRVECKQDNE